LEALSKVIERKSIPAFVWRIFFVVGDARFFFSSLTKGIAFV
jgi:hypothetical protein